MQRFGLYYPYVHFTSDAWVKAAALYWPRMARMLPMDFTAHDSDVVRELAARLDFIISLDPTGIVDDVSRMLEKVVSEHGDELVSRYAMHSEPSKPNSLDHLYATRHV